MSKVNVFETEEEQKINEEMASLLLTYNEIVKRVNVEIKKLIKVRAGFPKKFLQDEDYENRMITAAECKHSCINLKKIGISNSVSIDADIKYFSAVLQLDTADAYLSNKFDKITDKLRESYVRSNSNIHKLTKVKGKVEALREQSSDLVRQFNSDEFMFKEFMNKVTQLRGL